MLKTIVAAVVVSLVVCTQAAANPKEDNLALLNKGDFTGSEELLDKWIKAEPENPEVYIGYFNYYIAHSMKSGIGLDTVTPTNGKGYFTITDPKTGRVVGYMHGSTSYDKADIEKAISYLDQGLKFGPYRLDMYFGKTWVYMEIHDYENAEKTLASVFEESRKIGDAWLWSDGKKLEDGRKFLLGNVQGYYNQWFEEKSQDSLSAVVELSKIQIADFPKSSWGYANLGTALIQLESKENPLPYLEKAVELDPADMLNAINLARYYQLHGNLDEAKGLYQKVADGPDERFASFAKQRLEELDK